MAFFEEAKREAVPLMIGVAGPSGSGKTYSALLLAAGLAGPNGKVGLIDTELGRGSMYADDPDIIAAMPGGKYHRHEMTEPFTPEKYGNAIKEAVNAGITALAIDSATHEWEGLGGCQDIAEKNKLRGLPNWALAKLHHKRMMNQAAQSPLHIVFGLRARPKTKPGKNDKGEVVMIELGMQAIQEKNFMYEMTVSMMLDEATNLPTITKCPKPLRHLFEGEPKLLSKGIGTALRFWAEGGEPIDTRLRSLKQRCRDAAMMGNAALDGFMKALTRDEKDLVKTAGDDFKQEVRALADDADAVAAEQAASADPFAALPSITQMPRLDPETEDAIAQADAAPDVFTAGAAKAEAQTAPATPQATDETTIRNVAAKAADLFAAHQAEHSAPAVAEELTEEQLARQDYIDAGHPVIEDVLLCPETDYSALRQDVLKKIAARLMVPADIGLEPTPEAFEMIGGARLAKAMGDKGLGIIAGKVRQTFGAKV